MGLTTWFLKPIYIVIAKISSQLRVTVTKWNSPRHLTQNRYRIHLFHITTEIISYLIWWYYKCSRETHFSVTPKLQIPWRQTSTECHFLLNKLSVWVQNISKGPFYYYKITEIILCISHICIKLGYKNWDFFSTQARTFLDSGVSTIVMKKSRHADTFPAFLFGCSE